MADKKVVGEGSNMKATEKITALLAGLFLLSAIAAAVMEYLSRYGVDLGYASSTWGGTRSYFLTTIWPVWKLIAVFISVLCLWGIIHSVKSLRVINAIEKPIYDPDPVDESQEILIQPKNDRWEKVFQYANSNNPSDWRLAIIDADVMLEDALRAKGYAGESMGEVLKSIDKSDHLTLDSAWEAHKVRNDIAHAGQDFQLTERDTRHIISLYESVFKELGII